MSLDVTPLVCHQIVIAAKSLFEVFNEDLDRMEPNSRIKLIRKLNEDYFRGPEEQEIIEKIEEDRDWKDYEEEQYYKIFPTLEANPYPFDVDYPDGYDFDTDYHSTLEDIPFAEPIED